MGRRVGEIIAPSHGSKRDVRTSNVIDVVIGSPCAADHGISEAVTVGVPGRRNRWIRGVAAEGCIRPPWIYCSSHRAPSAQRIAQEEQAFVWVPSADHDIIETISIGVSESSDVIAHTTAHGDIRAGQTVGSRPCSGRAAKDEVGSTISVVDCAGADHEIAEAVTVQVAGSRHGSTCMVCGLLTGELRAGRDGRWHIASCIPTVAVVVYAVLTDLLSGRVHGRCRVVAISACRRPARRYLADRCLGVRVTIAIPIAIHGVPIDQIVRIVRIHQPVAVVVDSVARLVRAWTNGDIFIVTVLPSNLGGVVGVTVHIRQIPSVAVLIHPVVGDLLRGFAVNSRVLMLHRVLLHRVLHRIASPRHREHQAAGQRALRVPEDPSLREGGDEANGAHPKERFTDDSSTRNLACETKPVRVRAVPNRPLTRAAPRRPTASSRGRTGSGWVSWSRDSDDGAIIHQGSGAERALLQRHHAGQAGHLY